MDKKEKYERIEKNAHHRLTCLESAEENDILPEIKELRSSICEYFNNGHTPVEGSLPFLIYKGLENSENKKYEEAAKTFYSALKKLDERYGNVPQVEHIRELIGYEGLKSTEILKLLIANGALKKIKNPFASTYSLKNFDETLEELGQLSEKFRGLFDIFQRY